MISKTVKKFNKTLKVDGDKSISIRWLLLASQAIGISKATNLLGSEDVFSAIECLKKLGVNKEDLIGFKPISEFEFIVDIERFYCMKSNDIVIKYEYEGNEKEYNPSWTTSR